MKAGLTASSRWPWTPGRETEQEGSIPMFKRLKTKLDIENQLYLIQIFGIVVTAALCLVVMLTVTLSHSNQQQEEEQIGRASCRERV